jgi:amidohydrolase
MLQSSILRLANEYAPDTIAIRHHLHANPELSYQEFETSAFIQNQLQQLEIPFQVMAGTGVVGIIEGKTRVDRVVALRADIDALPIHEENKVDYKSTKEGIMHACGHDVHTSCLLGAARILKQLQSEIPGTIKLIFQPGEERNPGGASLLIKEGVLENPAPQCIFGMHVNPQLEIGKFSFRGGQVMASADEIYITIKAQGGHAAAPHLTPDPILIGSHLITALQQVISRNNNPLSPSVLSICSIQGGHTTNVIPSEVKMMGTFRALNEEWRYKGHELIRKITTSIVEGMGAKVDLHIDVGYPSVFNNEPLNEQARKQAEILFGNDAIETTEMRMGAEDFGYYSQKIPGCFFRLGVANTSKGITSGVHTPTFNIDESAIEKGMAMMAWLGMTGGN